MCTIPFVRWIANAAACLSGTRGAVSTQARQAGCSRQAIYDQARKVHSAVAAEYSDGPTREQLIRENRALRDENDRALAVGRLGRRVHRGEAAAVRRDGRGDGPEHRPRSASCWS